MGFYDYKVADTKGGEKDLKDFEGKVVLVVNTATGCGFTPQYKELEEMYEAFHDKGLEILDIPCNQFAGQTPGTDEEIHEFCTLNYNTRFPQMKKVDVNGETQISLYRFLKEQQGFKGFGEGKMADLLRDMLQRLIRTMRRIRRLSGTLPNSWWTEGEMLLPALIPLQTWQR